MKCMTYAWASTPPQPCQDCGRPHGEHHWEWAMMNNRYGGGEIALVPIPTEARSRKDSPRMNPEYLKPTHNGPRAARIGRQVTIGLARKARYEYLQQLAAQHEITLPTIPIDDLQAIHAALDILEAAGAEIDMNRLTIEGHP